MGLGLAVLGWAVAGRLAAQLAHGPRPILGVKVLALTLGKDLLEQIDSPAQLGNLDPTIVVGVNGPKCAQPGLA